MSKKDRKKEEEQIDQGIAEIEAKTRSELKNEVFVQPAPEVCGMKLRPFSASSLILLKKTKNPIISGDTRDVDDIEFHIAGFLFIHAAPLSEVRKASFKPDLFEEKVLEFAERMSIRDFSLAVKQIERIVTEASVGNDYEVEGDATPPFSKARAGLPAMSPT
jgi:hypothetical protein